MPKTLRRALSLLVLGTLIAGCASPAVATFDRAALDRAISDFDREVSQSLARGDSAIADLDTARRWAQEK